ncbi:hypothetical protein BC829DRAFT_273226 [Chytridium lagenaria]|nr:hypothetical protein BC829DRAFT_273226 [Chytridium lagenaria]
MFSSASPQLDLSLPGITSNNVTPPSQNYETPHTPRNEPITPERVDETLTDTIAKLLDDRTTRILEAIWSSYTTAQNSNSVTRHPQVTDVEAAVVELTDSMEMRTSRIAKMVHELVGRRDPVKVLLGEEGEKGALEGLKDKVDEILGKVEGGVSFSNVGQNDETLDNISDLHDAQRQTSNDVNMIISLLAELGVSQRSQNEKIMMAVSDSLSPKINEILTRVSETPTETSSVPDSAAVDNLINQNERMISANESLKEGIMKRVDRVDEKLQDVVNELDMKLDSRNESLIVNIDNIVRQAIMESIQNSQTLEKTLLPHLTTLLTKTTMVDKTMETITPKLDNILTHVTTDVDHTVTKAVDAWGEKLGMLIENRFGDHAQVSAAIMSVLNDMHGTGDGHSRSTTASLSNVEELTNAKLDNILEVIDFVNKSQCRLVTVVTEKLKQVTSPKPHDASLKPLLRETLTEVLSTLPAFSSSSASSPTRKFDVHDKLEDVTSRLSGISRTFDTRHDLIESWMERNTDLLKHVARGVQEMERMERRNDVAGVWVAGKEVVARMEGVLERLEKSRTETGGEEREMERRVGKREEERRRMEEEVRREMERKVELEMEVKALEESKRVLREEVERLEKRRDVLARVEEVGDELVKLERDLKGRVKGLLKEVKTLTAQKQGLILMG